MKAISNNGDMISRTLLILMLMVFGACAPPNDGSTETTPDQTVASARAELMALDQAWIEAEVNHEQEALEGILDERFLATFTSGETIDRTSFIEMIMKADIQPFEVIHDVIRVHDNTAVVIDLSSDRKTKYTWIAAKRMGQWRVLSETFTSVATPDE